MFTSFTRFGRFSVVISSTQWLALHFPFSRDFEMHAAHLLPLSQRLLTLCLLFFWANIALHFPLLLFMYPLFYQGPPVSFYIMTFLISTFSDCLFLMCIFCLLCSCLLRSVWFQRCSRSPSEHFIGAGGTSLLHTLSIFITPSLASVDRLSFV